MLSPLFIFEHSPSQVQGPGTCCLAISVIHHLASTLSDQRWKRTSSQRTGTRSAVEASLQIDNHHHHHRLKYARASREIQVPTDSCISVTTAMDDSQRYRAYVTLWSRIDSVSLELWNVKVVGRLMTTHVSFEVAVPLTVIVTNEAAERSFTSVNMLIHTACEWPFSCSVCDYQCRMDCDLKRHLVISRPSRIQ